jgi:hypothetical protein
MTTTTTTKRQRYGGYGLTEMRRMATEYKLPGRSKMDGHQLLAALRQHWHDSRVAAEQAVIAAAKPGALLRHKSTGTIMRLTSEVVASDNPHHDGALRFRAEHVEIGEGDGGLVGGWKGRGRDRARYLNEEDARRAENGHPTWHMLWQHEAI